MALKLTLKPGERIAVNGAVIVNGDRRTSFIIENQANVLRDRDVLQPADATTPAKRVYLPVMLMALDPAFDDGVHEDYRERLTEFVGVVGDPDALNACSRLAAHVANGEFYKALQVCRALIDWESTRLSDVA
jgi:flagellar protein FlbT